MEIVFKRISHSFIGNAMALSIALSFTFGNVTGQAQTAKEKAKCAYVIKNVKLDKAKQSPFSTTFYEYLKERKQARAPFEDMKDKLKDNIKAGTITEAQAQQLLNNKWIADEKEVQVRKKYTPIFVKIIGAKKTYDVFRFANDKIN